ncbi:MAG: SAVED domain-containing protein [Propionibacteriaceae bacterium]|nr:SAVED domain-containing protein [Propionibacteriaceae bacterium]
MTTNAASVPSARPDGAVFISYHHGSGSLEADFVEAYLRAGGIVPWRDVCDLDAGVVKRSICDAFEEGLSGAVLIVSEDIEQSEFVPGQELPLILDALEANPDTFQFDIVNTIRKQGTDKLDVEAPSNKLREKCPRADELTGHRQSALLRSNRPEENPVNELGTVLRGLLRRRLDHWKKTKRDQVLDIEVQTRPEPNHRSVNTHTPTACDLHIRLRQNHSTHIPDELDLHCLKAAIPYLIDAIDEHKIPHVRFRGGAHPSLAWALGTALPKSRPGIQTFTWRDGQGNVWTSDQSHEKPKTSMEFWIYQPGSDQGERVERSQLRQLLGLGNESRDVVVLLAADRHQNAPLQELARTRGNGRALVIELHGPANQNGEKRIPSEEGAALARQVGSVLRELADGAHLHLAVSAPVGLAALAARETNTISVDFYELATLTGGVKTYLPVMRLSAGSKSPITGVFPQDAPKIAEIRQLVNRTPHAVTIYSEDESQVTWKAPPSDAEWVRRQEVSEPLEPLLVDGREIRLTRIRQGQIAPVPPMLPGVGYIVPRISAEAARRPDFFFPYDEVRDANGTILGCRGLGCFGAMTDRARPYLGWISPIPDELP